MRKAMRNGSPDAAAVLPAACRLLASMKYRIDDFLMRSAGLCGLMR
jgi:hypothetical protein